MGSRLFRKVALSLAAMIGVSAVTVLLVVTPRVEADALRQIDLSLRARAAVLREIARGPLAGDVPADFHERIRRLGAETGTRYTVIREAEGLVLADSEADPAVMESHGLRPEVRRARQTGEAAAVTRSSRTTNRAMRYMALPVRDGETLVGFVRTSLPTADIDERRADVRRRVALGAGVAAVVGLALGLLLTHRLTRRLGAMAGAARAIAEGRERGPLPTDVSDETGDLARAIERLDEQLRQRMEALVRERNESTAVLGSMLEGVVAVDRGERVVHMNAVAGEILHASPAESIGKRIWEITRVQDVCEALDAVLKDNKELSREIRLADQPRARTLELHASPLRDSHQDAAGAVVVLHDVTELRRLEVVRREFVANVSHELKTPLTAIRGLVETLIDDDESVDPATRLRFLERARDQSLRLSSLVTDLLALSRIESEEFAIESHALDLRDPIRESARRLDPTLAGRALEFDVSLPEDPVPLLGDEEAIRQIVDNLLDNAIKYTADGGRVSLRLGVAGPDAVVEVCDTGIGIDPVHIDRIFERFYRVDKARSRELGGTGLGLAIVKHLVEALSGHVDFESEPGRGSVFRVSFPIATPATGADAE